MGSKSKEYETLMPVQVQAMTRPDGRKSLLFYRVDKEPLAIELESDEQIRLLIGKLSKLLTTPDAGHA